MMQGMRGDEIGRVLAVGLVGAVLALGACSSSAKKATPPRTTTTAVPTTVTPTTVTTTSSSPSTATSAVTTTTGTCPAVGSTAPVTTPASQASALLTKVTVTSAGCDDRVGFLYRVGGAAPSCTIGYRAGPFTQDGSGAPVAVAGTAFVVVRCSPAYGYDFETGMPTYTGPNRIEATRTRHVREIVKTGDNEGVLTWVIGVDTRRPFTASATAAPTKQLVVTFS